MSWVASSEVKCRKGSSLANKKVAMSAPACDLSFDCAAATNGRLSQ